MGVSSGVRRRYRSIRSLSEIATGVTSGLLSRAADVVLKERRKLVLMVRETPFHLGHLRSMTQVVEMGAIAMPPLPAFYTNPRQSTISSITVSLERWIYSASISETFADGVKPSGSTIKGKTLRNGCRKIVPNDQRPRYPNAQALTSREFVRIFPKR